jgi:hypothetical protein
MFAAPPSKTFSKLPEIDAFAVGFSGFSATSNIFPSLLDNRSSAWAGWLEIYTE